MRLKTSTLLLALAALVPAAPAHAAPAATAKVASCQTGDQAADRKATFLGHMHAVPGSAELDMRFQLEERYGGLGFEKLAASELRGWRRSRSGVQSYSYAQAVAGLPAGESYRVQVHFRWLDAAGRTLLDARRYSGVCDQPGRLPNLQILAVTGQPGAVPGTEVYAVDVLNAGLAPAEHVAVQLVVDGTTPDTGAIGALAPGEVQTVNVTGPLCNRRVRATLDPSDAIHETFERDNSAAMPCPAQG
jgi:hypothetical protein